MLHHWKEEHIFKSQDTSYIGKINLCGTVQTCWVFLALALCHMLYLCICVFVFLYVRLTHGNIILISLSNPLLKNISHVGYFWHFVICCIFVFVNFVFVFFVFARLTHGNIIFDILEQSPFQKYSTCSVFLAFRHMLYLCICVFCICSFCICAFDTWENHI